MGKINLNYLRSHTNWFKSPSDTQEKSGKVHREVLHEPSDDKKHEITLERCIKLFRVIVGATCLSCYVSSVYIITQLYLEHNTVVSTEFVKSRHMPLPAVTVCAPFAIPFTRLCKHLNYTDDNECYHQLKNTYHISSLEDFFTKMIPEGEMGLVQAYHTDKYLTSGPARPLIDTVFFRTAKLYCEISTENVSSVFAGLDLFHRSNCKEGNGSRVLSLIYNTKKIGKSAQLCQTFFSKYEANYDETDYTIDLKIHSNNMAFFKFQLLSSWFPIGHKAEGVSIAIHPPHIIPSDSDVKYFTLKVNKSYQIEYERQISNLLPPPFKTMCENYTDSPMSRGDCIQKCVYAKAWDEKNQCRNQWYVIRLNQLRLNEKLCPLDGSKDHYYHSVMDACEQGCKNDCYDIDYDSKIEIVDEDFKPYSYLAIGDDDNGTEDFYSDALSNINDVTIRHQTGPEMIITHNPDSIFSGLMANIGGLGGIYLGLNILASYGYLASFILKMRKFRSLQVDTNQHRKDSLPPSPTTAPLASKRSYFKKYYSLDFIPVAKSDLKLDSIKEAKKVIV